MGAQKSRINPGSSTTTSSHQTHNTDNMSSFSSCCISWNLINSTKNVNNQIARPTSDEVQEWSTNFDALLGHDYGLRLFYDFLKSQHSQENLNFWIAVQRYKSKSEELKCAEAKSIYETYISIMSPTEISIDSKTRNEVEMNMTEPNMDTFKPAQDQIYILMKRDCLPRFLKSKHYKQLKS